MKSIPQLKSIPSWSVLWIFLILLTTDVDAQREGRRNNSRRGGMQQFFNSGMMSLFRIPTVQAELDLKRESAELVFALQADLYSEYRNARRDESAAKDLPTPEQVSAESERVAERLLSAILAPEQFSRLQELWLQRRGLRAIVMDDLADALALSPEQRMATKKMVDRLSRNYGRGRISEEDAEIAKQIAEQLTPEQQKRWETMLGKPFDF